MRYFDRVIYQDKRECPMPEGLLSLASNLSHLT